MNNSDYFSNIACDPEYQKAKAALQANFALGEAIIRERIQRNWTQAELAQHVGTKQANISRIEAGLGNPTLKVVQKILQVLDLKVSFASNVALPSSYNTILVEIAEHPRV